jgi:8-oxo-dGTP pyrophosphatase MutT (NUDIX family)
MRHEERWDLPKGHVDPGETRLQAAYRELYEETRISHEHIRLDGRYRYKQRYVVPGKRYGLSGDLEKTLIIYLAELLLPVDIQAVEHIAYEWFRWNPPHDIQEKTINPLLADVDMFWKNHGICRLPEKSRSQA